MGKTFSIFQNLTLKSLLPTVNRKLKSNFGRSSGKHSTKKPYDYDTLPLRLYFKIVETKDFNLIARGVVGVDAPRLWEDIIRQSERDTNSIVYFKRIDDLKTLRDLIAEYVIVKASLIRLLYKRSLPIINDLAERGYTIDQSNSTDYAISVYNNLQVVNNLITKLQTKSNELAADEMDGATSTNFDAAMAGLSMALGFTVPDDITLRRFNAYQKLIRRKNESKPHSHGD